MTKYMEKGVHLVAAGNVLVILHYILLSLHVWAASRNLIAILCNHQPKFGTHGHGF